MRKQKFNCSHQAHNKPYTFLRHLSFNNLKEKGSVHGKKGQERRRQGKRGKRERKKEKGERDSWKKLSLIPVDILMIQCTLVEVHPLVYKFPLLHFHFCHKSKSHHNHRHRCRSWLLNKIHQYTDLRLHQDSLYRLCKTVWYIFLLYKNTLCQNPTIPVNFVTIYSKIKWWVVNNKMIFEKKNSVRHAKLFFWIFTAS